MMTVLDVFVFVQVRTVLKQNDGTRPIRLQRRRACMMNTTKRENACAYIVEGFCVSVILSFMIYTQSPQCSYVRQH